MEKGLNNFLPLIMFLCTKKLLLLLFNISFSFYLFCIFCVAKIVLKRFLSSSWYPHLLYYLFIIHFFEQRFLWVLPSSPCSFCGFFSKPLRPNVLFQWGLFMSIIVCLLLLYFLEFVFFYKYWIYVILPGTSTSFMLQNETRCP